MLSSSKDILAEMIILDKNNPQFAREIVAEALFYCGEMGAAGILEGWEVSCFNKKSFFFSIKKFFFFSMNINKSCGEKEGKGFWSRGR